MSDHQHVRVHLRQVIMVGHGETARYAKVLTGIRKSGDDTQRGIAVCVTGCIVGYTNHFRATRVEPACVHLLADDNILSIETMEFAHNQHFPDCPPTGPTPYQSRPIETVPCAFALNPHPAHQYRRGPVTDCPGS